MKYTCIAVFILSLLATLNAHSLEHEKLPAVDLTVVVTDLKHDQGHVTIKLFNSKEGYTAKGATPFRMITLTPNFNRANGVFKDLPPGEYAIKLYHDENGNGQHDKNFMGLPKEAYGFSNNARGVMGPPKYHKAKFSMVRNMTMEITLLKNSNHKANEK